MWIIWVLVGIIEYTCWRPGDPIGSLLIGAIICLPMVIVARLAAAVFGAAGKAFDGMGD